MIGSTGVSFYRLFFLFFAMLTSYGCSNSYVRRILSDQSQECIASSGRIESESLPPPTVEDEHFLNEDNIVSPPVSDIMSIKMSMLGAWKRSHQGVDCDVFLTLTRFKKHFRSTSRGCYGRLAMLSAWNITTDKLELKNGKGDNIIVLNKVDDQIFEGTFGGVNGKVSFHRHKLPIN